MSLPSRVLKSGRRVEPFDGNRICRDLFAATRALGRPNADLARELTDGILHFLAADHAGDPTPIGDVIDAAVKVVRELGHPLLARAFADRVQPPTPEAGRAGAAPPVPAETSTGPNAGMVRLLGPTPTSKMFAAAVCLPAGRCDLTAWVDAIADARERVGHLIVLDSPDWCLPSVAAAETWARQLHRAIAASGLASVVNLNVSQPPAWSVQPPATDRFREAERTEALLSALLDDPNGRIRVDWHLGRTDALPDRWDRLRRLAARVVAGDEIAFVVDQPRRPISLAEGIDRENPDVFAGIVIDLAQQVKSGPPAEDSTAWVAFPARQSIAIGRSVRNRLRVALRGTTRSEFLLERSRLLVVPAGLERLVHLATDGPAVSGDGSTYVQKILLGLNATMAREAGALPMVIDGPMFRSVARGGSDEPFPLDSEPLEYASPIAQLRGVARLHSALGGGSATITLPAELASDTENIASLLEFAARQPGLSRFRFETAPRRLRQLTAGW